MAESKKQLRVSAPLVMARTKNDRVVHLYKGDIVPEEITKESVDNLKDLGFVTTDDVQPA